MGYIMNSFRDHVWFSKEKGKSRKDLAHHKKVKRKMAKVSRRINRKNSCKNMKNQRKGNVFTWVN